MIVMPKAAYANAVYDSGIAPSSVLTQSVHSAIQSQILNTTNKPGGGDTGSDKTWGAAKNVVKNIADFHASVGVGGISITFIGETHGDANDEDKAGKVLNAHANADLIIYERGLRNKYGGPILPTGTAREEDIETHTYGGPGSHWGLGLTLNERNYVVAGYMVLCVASGNQNLGARILLFFGENHVQILHQFENIAGFVAPWILKRKRNLHFVKAYDSSRANNWGIKL